MKIHLLVMMLASTPVACTPTGDTTTPAPTTTTTTPTTTLPSEGSVRGVYVPLKQGAGNKCDIGVKETDRVQAYDNDSIRWTADVDANATNCKPSGQAKFKISDVYEIDCAAPYAPVTGSTLKPLEDCDHDANTANGGKVRLICSLLLPSGTTTPRCFKYTIKAANDKVDPQIEIDPGAIMQRSAKNVQ
jgi:hypothetical protein